MFYKSIIISLFCCFSSIIAQTKNNEWQVGIGIGITKFSDKNATYIGDKHQIQLPRLNVTMPIADNLAVDAAVSFNTFDFSFITNVVNYFSFDASLRYFYPLTEKFYPYAFAGLSVAKTTFNTTPTFNIGAGVTYWLTNVIGLNSQLYYKQAGDSNNIRSHIQITGGLNFSTEIFNRSHTIDSICF